MHDSTADLNVGQKGAQQGFSETMLNIIFFKVDVERQNCLYVLPNKTPDASNFSSARFDAALELSPYLRDLFSDVKNIGHKRAGSVNLYIRGSKSRSGLKSVPVSFYVMDEVEEFEQKNISLIAERAAGQTKKQGWIISTPSFPEVGINAWMLKSTQEHFFFKCPGCSRYIELLFPDNFDVEREISFCTHCKTDLPHETKPDWLSTGIWVPQTQSGIRGFYVNQLYSSTVKPSDFAAAYKASLLDPYEEQEFYNSKLGVPHIVAGSSVLDKDVRECYGSHKMGFRPHTRIITMGVDVGSKIHYEVTGYTVTGSLVNDLTHATTAQVLEAGHVMNFDELHAKMHQYKVQMAIVDANPERREALKFARDFPGRCKLCFYVVGSQTREYREDEEHVYVDRTSWLDASLSRFKNRTIVLPIDIPREYEKHITNLVRKYEKDDDGNVKVKYIKRGDDHLGHARNYSEIAMTLCVNPMECRTLNNIL